MASTGFQIKKTYDFKTLAPAILNSDYKSQKVIAIFTSVEAVKYIDIQTLHANVSKVIPSLPSSVNDLTYILFENTSQEKTVLALEYIDQDTIKEVVTYNIRIDVKGANSNDLALLRKYLLELGYTNIYITTFN